MEGNLILDSVRKAILARLAALGRHFCQDDVDEMVGMTVERFYTRGAYDPSKSSVKTYVSHIAYTVVYDFVKAADKARGRTRSLDSSLGPKTTGFASRLIEDRGADTRLLQNERDRIVDEAVHRLAPRQQAYFRLLREGLSYQEIAVLMDTTAGNVAVVACRMKKRIQALLPDAA